MKTSEHIFLSHAAEDRAVAHNVCTFLERRGFVCWIAPRDVTPGESYPAEIMRGIDRSGVIVLVLSEESNESKMVAREIERAVNRNKIVVPLRIADVALGPDLEFLIAGTHWIDAWEGPLDTYLEWLARTVEKALATRAKAPEPVVPRESVVIRGQPSATAAAEATAQQAVVATPQPTVSSLTSGEPPPDNSADIAARDSVAGNRQPIRPDRLVGRSVHTLVPTLVVGAVGTAGGALQAYLPVTGMASIAGLQVWTIQIAVAGLLMFAILLVLANITIPRALLGAAVSSAAWLLADLIGQRLEAVIGLSPLIVYFFWGILNWLGPVLVLGITIGGNPRSYLAILILGGLTALAFLSTSLMVIASAIFMGLPAAALALLADVVATGAISSTTEATQP